MAIRWDYTSNSTTYLGLSTEEKDNEDVIDGDTFVELDTKKVFVYYKGEWYEL